MRSLFAANALLIALKCMWNQRQTALRGGHRSDDDTLEPLPMSSEALAEWVATYFPDAHQTPEHVELLHQVLHLLSQTPSSHE